MESSHRRSFAARQHCFRGTRGARPVSTPTKTNARKRSVHFYSPNCFLLVSRVGFVLLLPVAGGGCGGRTGDCIRKELICAGSLRQRPYRVGCTGPLPIFPPSTQKKGKLFCRDAERPGLHGAGENDGDPAAWLGDTKVFCRSRVPPRAVAQGYSACSAATGGGSGRARKATLQASRRHGKQGGPLFWYSTA